MIENPLAVWASVIVSDQYVQRTRYEIVLSFTVDDHQFTCFANSFVVEYYNAETLLLSFIQK